MVLTTVFSRPSIDNCALVLTGQLGNREVGMGS